MFGRLHKRYRLWALCLFDGHRCTCISIIWVTVFCFFVQGETAPDFFIIHPVQPWAAWRLAFGYYLLELLFLGAFVSVFLFKLVFQVSFYCIEYLFKLDINITLNCRDPIFMRPTHAPKSLQSSQDLHVFIILRLRWLWKRFFFFFFKWGTDWQ